MKYCLNCSALVISVLWFHVLCSSCENQMMMALSSGLPCPGVEYGSPAKSTHGNAETAREAVLQLTLSYDSALLIKCCWSSCWIRAFAPCILSLKNTDGFQQQGLQAIVHGSNSSRSWLEHNAGMPPYLLFFNLLYSIMLAAGDV